MTLATNLSNFATRAATQSKALKTLINGNAADLSGLTTTVKTNLVAAINELDAAIDSVAAGSGAISDGTTSTGSTWSSSKTSTEIVGLINDALATGGAKTWSVTKIVAAIAAAGTQVKSDLTNGAGAALDTLKELADALGGDANFAASMATSLANRVRVDAVQALTTGQKLQACQNIGVGDPEADLVAVFNAGLV